MKEIKPIYYSEKSKKYYFNSTSVFGHYFAETVWNGANLKGGEIKTDKNGRQYILGVVEKVKSRNGRYYYTCVGPYTPSTVDDNDDQTDF